MTLERWFAGLLRCPVCRGRLTEHQQTMQCARCGPYPVLAGVPVLVPDPARWCARFRESVLSTMAEFQEADFATVGLLDAFASAVDGVEPERFGDDWTAHERAGVEAPRVASEEVASFLAAVKRTPHRWLQRRLGAPAQVLEVGCGVGVGSAALAARAARVVLGDVSLRAVLVARARASQQAGEVEGVVLDAASLPFASGVFDVVVAEQVVDVLDEPASFFASARRVLAGEGRALVTTPQPALADGEVSALAAEVGLEIRAVARGLTWARVNSSRFVELYAVDGFELAAGRAPRRGARRK